MQLVLWVCLLAQPAACREERVPTEVRAALVMECKAAMEEWAVGHPWLSTPPAGAAARSSTGPDPS